MKSNNSDTNKFPKEHIQTGKAKNLIDEYENFYNIPKKERHENCDSDEMLLSIYEKALNAIEWDSEGFQSNTFFDDKLEIASRMRSCALVKILQEGDKVICVPNTPFDSQGKIHYKHERIAWIETEERLLCGVESQGKERWIPPSYVLARYNENHSGSAFGFPNTELLCLNHERDALPMLCKAQKQSDGINHSLNTMTNAFMEAGLLPENAAIPSEAKSISAGELRTLPVTEGLILQGCGGDPQEWIDGINEMLTDEGILLDGDKFSDVYSFEHDGTTNLLFSMDDVKLNVGKLAMWRLGSHETFGGTWLSDYLPNRLGVDGEPIENSGMQMGGVE